MQDGMETHASEETLERYVLGDLTEAELASFEEHLLVCVLCQDRLAETEAFVRATREAARNLQTQRVSVAGGLLSRLGMPDRVWTPVLVVAAVALGVLGWWNLWRETQAPAVAVVLQSVRGAEGWASAQAPSGRPLLVRLDLNGVPEASAYELEVVDARGRPVHRTSLRRAGSSAQVNLARLEAGQYWVRLYRPPPQRELLREFGLRVE